MQKNHTIFHGSYVSVMQQGSNLREKTAFFTQKKKKKKKKKKSRLRKSENALRLLYAKKQWPHTSKCFFSLFIFCTQQRRFVEHLPWV